MGGDNIGRVVILEFKEQDSAAFDDILLFLQQHPDLKKMEIAQEPILSLPGLEINFNSRKVVRTDSEIELTAKEYDILCLLVVNKGRVLTYAQIYEKVWGSSAFGNERKAVSYHIWNLRRKLCESDNTPPIIIVSVREVVYRLEINR